MFSAEGGHIPQDPMILLSYLNTQLRDTGDSLTEFCKARGLDAETVTEKLAAVGFRYDAAQNRFR